MALFQALLEITKVSAGQSFFCSSSRVINSPGRSKQQGENFHRLALQPNPHSLFAKFFGGWVELEDPKAEDMRQ
jgi:hypothetical protein